MVFVAPHTPSDPWLVAFHPIMFVRKGNGHRVAPEEDHSSWKRAKIPVIVRQHRSKAVNSGAKGEPEADRPEVQKELRKKRGQGGHGKVSADEPEAKQSKIKEEAEAKKKRGSFTAEDLENAKGMILGQKSPKEEVHVFVERYCARQITKEVDYKYSAKPSRGGWIASLTVWAWSNDAYWGTLCWDQRDAEAAAARAFLEDPEVIDAAAHLPPPLHMIRHYLWPIVYNLNPELSVSERQARVEEGVQKYISECVSSGCRNAISDRRA